MLLLLVSFSSFAQNLDAYFKYKGIRGLSDLSHPANIFLSGEYKVSQNTVDVWIKSKDNILGGLVETHLLIYKGVGGLYFNDITVVSDTDPFAKPFEALKAMVDIIQDLMKQVDRESFEKMRTDFVKTFGSDVHQWSGKTWALLALNLDYMDYSGK